MICFLKLRKQLTLTAASAVFALTAASTMILAATSALTLSAASALALPEDFFDLDEMLERMSEFFRDRFWLRRDDDMMTLGIEGAKRMSALWKVWTASNLPVLIFLLIYSIERWGLRMSRMSEFNSKFGGGRDAKESIAFCIR